MKRALGTLGLLLLWPQRAPGQTPAPITSYELQVYAAGVDPQTGAPTQVNPIPLSVVLCNLAPTPMPTGTVINPRTLEFTDPAVSGRACRVDRSTFLLALPVLPGYRLTLTALSSAGPSARSNTSNPFDVTAVPPAAPTGVGVRP